MHWPDYRAHQAFIAPARNRAEVWRLLVGLFLAALAMIAFNQLFFDVMYRLAGDQRGALYDQIISGTTPLAMYIQLFTFGFLILSVAITLRFLHHRPIRSLLGPLRPCLSQFAAVAVMLLAVGFAIFLLPPWDMGAEYLPNIALGVWVMLLPLSLLAVLVQVSAEELLFRGYVQQQLAARFRSPFVWMVLPSVLFSLGHYLPDTAGENALIIAVWAGLFGILMADLTARSGTLGPAIAVHFINNISAILIVSLPDNLSGLALYLTPFSLEDTAQLRAWLPVDFGLMVVFWLAARLAIRR